MSFHFTFYVQFSPRTGSTSNGRGRVKNITSICVPTFSRLMGARWEKATIIMNITMIRILVGLYNTNSSMAAETAAHLQLCAIAISMVYFIYAIYWNNEKIQERKDMSDMYISRFVGLCCCCCWFWMMKWICILPHGMSYAYQAAICSFLVALCIVVKVHSA